MSNGDPYQDTQETIGADQRLALSRVAIQDMYFLSETHSQFVPKQPTNIRNYYLTHRDVNPVGSTTNRVPFGSLVQFKFGNEGLPNLYALELHIEMPAVYTAVGGHLAGTGPGGAAATFLDWCPYVAERFISKNGEPARIMYGTETLRSFTSTALHTKRVLCYDSEASTKLAAYNNSVGAVQDSTAAIRYFRIPIPMPQGTDDVNFHQMLPVQSFGQEFVLKFQIASMLELIVTDGTPSSCVAQGTGSAAYPAVFLRCHYHVPEKAERGLYSNMLSSPKGLTFQTMHIARETQVTAISALAQTVKTDIRQSTNPCVFLVAGLRWTDDTYAAGATMTYLDTNPTPRSIVTTVCNPNWTNWLRWDAVSVNDGGNRIIPKRGYDDWQNSVCNGISCYFPCQITTNLCVVPFSAFPRIENNGLGHISLTTLNKPQLWLDIPTTASTSSFENASMTRVLDILYFERNMVHMKDANIIRWFAVQD